MSPLYLFIFTQLASTGGFFVVAGVVWLCLLIGQHTRAWAFFIATLGVVISTSFLKELLHVARPEHPLIPTEGYAFPSGHAAGSLFLAIEICYSARHLARPLRYLVYVLSLGAAFAIGISRVELGVHTPFQVVAGYFLGAAWGLGYIAYIQRVRR
jgi:undecaprenyl-diphosphatase